MSEHTIRIFLEGALWAVPLLAAIVFHEVAHGAVARYLGDPTAARAGRLTLNPLPHVDLFGTILLPALLLLAQSPFLFGWAKPVPVDPARLRNPRRDAMLVAAAGPGANCALALASSLVLIHLLPFLSRVSPPSLVASLVVPLEAIAARTILINAVLAVFNLLPIPPLDGGRVLTGLLPGPVARLVAGVEPFGVLLVVALMATRSLGGIVGYPIGLLLWAIGTPFSFLASYM